jgi:hypothetical protein
MKLVEEMRYKSVVIPIINGKYVSVRDAKHREVTFVTGGCKLLEISNLKLCALRELREETYGALGTLRKEDLVHAGVFKTRNRSESELRKDELNGVVVTMVYHVYFTYVDKPWDGPNGVKRTFERNSKKVPKKEKETDEIYLLSKENYESRKNMWWFMKANVLPFLN